MAQRDLNLEAVKRIDKSDILAELMDFPLQCKQSSDIASKIGLAFAKKDFKNILFSGMGGSSIGLGLAKSYLYCESHIPILLCSQPDIPAWVDKETLAIISSYSGSTQETVSTYKQAREKGSTIITMSSNGHLEELARRDNVTFIKIPNGLIPRYALGYLSIIPLCILSRLGLVKDKQDQIDKMRCVLEDLRDRYLNPSIDIYDNIAKNIALRLFNKFVVVYAPPIPFDVVGMRLRSQLNENSKALASSNFFPEINHNEITGWYNPKKLLKSFVVIILKDKYLEPYVKKGMDITEDILKREGIEVITINSRGEELVSRIFSLIYIGDFISFYLAILYGINPAATERITYLKKELSKINV